MGENPSPGMIFCSYCGINLPPGVRFCWSCGQAVVTGMAALAPEPAPEPLAEPEPAPEPLAEPVAAVPEPLAEPVPAPEPLAEPELAPEPLAEPVAAAPEPLAEPTPEPLAEPVPEYQPATPIPVAEAPILAAGDNWSPPASSQLDGDGEPEADVLGPDDDIDYGYLPDPPRRNSTPIVLALAVVGLIAVLVVSAVRAFGLGSSHTPAVSIYYQLSPASGSQVTPALLDTTVDILRNRLDGAGIAGTVERIAPDRVSVHLDKASDLSAVRDRIAAPGQLSFVLLPPAIYGDVTAAGSQPIPYVGSTIDPSLPAQFTGNDLDHGAAGAAADINSPGYWLVDFAFAGDSATQFATWSGQHVNDFFAIVLDGEVLSAPYIKSQIIGGRGQIAGQFRETEAKALAAILRSGALPVPLVEVSSELPTASGSASAGTGGLPLLPIVPPSQPTPSDIPRSGRTLGDLNAPVTLDVWEDYQCPPCGDFGLMVLPKLIDTYVKPGSVKVVVHDYIVIDVAMGGHESSDAANAAMCAADQGKFWTFQDWLLANQGREASGAFSETRLLEIGRRAGLLMNSFQTCVQTGAHLADLRTEALTRPASVDATPKVIVNGRTLDTWDYASVAAAIDATLAGPPTSLSPSPSGSPSGSGGPTSSATPASSLSPSPPPGV